MLGFGEIVGDSVGGVYGVVWGLDVYVDGSDIV